MRRILRLAFWRPRYLTALTRPPITFLREKLEATPHRRPHDYAGRRRPGHVHTSRRQRTVESKHPENISFEEAAASWMQYVTAWGALVEQARLTQGDFVIVTAASSSVGIAAFQTARAVGATVIATTQTSAKRQALLDQSGIVKSSSLFTR
jgi:hypothetical protein